MPRYSYICTNCENKVEASHSIDERLSSCESCKTDTLKKVLSIPNIVSNNSAPLTKHKNGDIVNEKIEEFRQDLKKQKRELMDREK